MNFAKNQMLERHLPTKPFIIYLYHFNVAENYWEAQMPRLPSQFWRPWYIIYKYCKKQVYHFYWWNSKILSEFISTAYFRFTWSQCSSNGTIQIGEDRFLIQKNRQATDLQRPCAGIQNVVCKLLTFNAIISHFFLKNFIEIPQVVQNIWRFSPTKLSIFIDCLLTLPCYKETNDVSIYMSVDDVIIFFYFQPILIGFLTIA